MQNKKGIILIIMVCMCILSVSIAAWYVLNKNNNTNNNPKNNNNPYGGRDGLYNDSINYESDTISQFTKEFGFGGRFQ